MAWSAPWPRAVRYRTDFNRLGTAKRLAWGAIASKYPIEKDHEKHTSSGLPCRNSLACAQPDNSCTNQPEQHALHAEFQPILRNTKRFCRNGGRHFPDDVQLLSASELVGILRSKRRWVG